jgi:hypothetical protein
LSWKSGQNLTVIDISLSVAQMERYYVVQLWYQWSNGSNDWLAGHTSPSIFEARTSFEDWCKYDPSAHLRLVIINTVDPLEIIDERIPDTDKTS